MNVKNLESKIENSGDNLILNLKRNNAGEEIIRINKLGKY